MAGTGCSLLYVAFVLCIVWTSCQCQYSNIDLTTSSTQCNTSSLYTSALFGDSLDCRGAINGNRDTRWTAVGEPSPNCVYTEQWDTDPYWLVDMGQEYNIHRITVFHDPSDTDYMRDVLVSVDNRDIFTFPSLDSGISNPQEITGGNLPTRGRILQIKRTTSYFYNYIQLCEVEVSECTAGRHGADCQLTCGAGCQNDTCDSITGNCTCRPGWAGSQCHDCETGIYGLSCNETCSAGCQNNTCDVISGNCTCRTGWAGSRCEDCQTGNYGSDCQESCSVGCNDTCDTATGSCTCNTGWEGSNCDACSSDYYNRSTSDIPTPGDCAPCGSGCNDTCDGQTGQCNCLPGFQPPYCDTECASGTFGHNCSLACAPGCDGPCHVITGNCSCGLHWRQPSCTECAAGYYDPDSGCPACGAGCETMTSCDGVSGSCTCKPGWSSPTCHACEALLWGDNCSLQCGHCAGDGSCQQSTGTCNFGCEPTWDGHNCTQKLYFDINDKDIGPFIGITVCAGVLFAVSVITVCLMIRSQKVQNKLRPRKEMGRKHERQLQVDILSHKLGHSFIRISDHNRFSP